MSCSLNTLIAFSVISAKVGSGIVSLSWSSVHDMWSELNKPREMNINSEQLRMSYKKLELLILRDNLFSPLVFEGVFVAHLFRFMCCVFVSLCFCFACLHSVYCAPFFLCLGCQFVIAPSITSSVY